MSDANESEQSAPASGRWQFSLCRMFVATTAVAIVFGLAAWANFSDNIAVVCLAMTALAGVFSSSARYAIFGACIILVACCLALAFGPTIDDVWPHGTVEPPAGWLLAIMLVMSGAGMREISGVGPWPLVASLVLVELFIVVVIIYNCGCSTLFQTLVPDHRQDVLNAFLDWFPEQRWYIAAPWLLGIAVGEIIVRRRKPSGGQGQLV